MIYYLDDMEDLEDILDEIRGHDTSSEDDESIVEFFPDEEAETDFVESCIALMYDFVDENPQAISEPDFEEQLLENVRELFLIPFHHFFFDKNRASYEDEIDELLNTAKNLFYIQFNPPRSYPDTFVRKMPNIPETTRKIQILRDIPLPGQRTKEWYEYRHRLITASNAYKAFENESIVNQLIYEKCQPLLFSQSETTATTNTSVNVDSTFHWGQKYEPVSLQIYEDMFDTKVGEFGCIPHQKYSFIGASPDGINIDPKSSRYGRMLEIKNIVNREIDGIPKKEYWIQMQLQMETCDLDECDFLETRFVEYETESAFLSDGSFLTSMKEERKGFFMYFSTAQGKPIYEYKPINMCEAEAEVWSLEMMKKYDSCDNHITWIRNIYWRLEEMSCVLVPRNEKWFQDNLPRLQEVWSIIETERMNGFSHRAPQKREKKEATPYVSETKCLINIKKLKEGAQFSASVPESTPVSQLNVIKIRTESIDETKETMESELL